MIIPRLAFDATYEVIKEKSGGGGCTVLIFVAADVDGICACKILTVRVRASFGRASAQPAAAPHTRRLLLPSLNAQAMLRADNISYKVKPVSGYMDIKAQEAMIADDDDLRSIVMLNCGAIVDVQGMLGLRRDDGEEDEEDERVTCYILDSHRPIHLKNVYADESDVRVLLGETTDVGDYPSAGSDLSEIEADDSDSEEDDDGYSDDDAPSDGSGDRGQKRRRHGVGRRGQAMRCVSREK